MVYEHIKSDHFCCLILVTQIIKDVNVIFPIIAHSKDIK